MRVSYMQYFTNIIVSNLVSSLYFNHCVKDKKTPRLQSASELYRPSDRRPSVKLVPTIAD
jgi:hypothetical protein